MSQAEVLTLVFSIRHVKAKTFVEDILTDKTKPLPLNNHTKNYRNEGPIQATNRQCRCLEHQGLSENREVPVTGSQHEFISSEMPKPSWQRSARPHSHV